MLELLAEGEGLLEGVEAWRLRVSPLPGVRQLGPLGWAQVGPPQRKSDGGQVKSFWGPRGEQREGLGILDQKDGVEAAPAQPQLEGQPTALCALVCVTRGPCTPAVSRLSFISLPQPQFTSGRG